MSGLYPGDVRSLGDLEKLAKEQEWAVLAALVVRNGELSALGALASAADDWRAFAWMWAVLNEADPHHCQQLAERLAGGIAVPENLRDAVFRFVLAPAPLTAASAHDTYQHKVNNAVLLRRAAQREVLASLDPRKAFAVGLAREVLDAEEGRLWTELRHAAFDVLGASRKRADRSALFERAEERVPHGRLRPLLGLTTPYLKDEEKRIRSVLAEALPVRGPFTAGGTGEEDHWGFARRLAARLSAPALVGLLGAPWAEHEADRERLFGSDFAPLTGQEKLQVLLTSALPDDTRRHLIRAAAANLSLKEKADLGRWTHANLPPEWSGPLRDSISGEARPNRRSQRSEAGREALEALRDFALACRKPRRRSPPTCSPARGLR